ncbi:MAG: hypothetical protein II229_00360, partial [Clostridia bacterium]|nr:hypothetical protein [Clostridia bacterium]
DIILTHNPEDYNPDHELTSKIVNDIAVMIPVAKIQTRNRPYDKIPMIAYFEPVNGLGFVPTEYVDITDTMDIKMAMCREHKSQVTWMQDNYKDTLANKDFLEQYYTVARYRGLQCGVEYAEGFRMANDAFRVAPFRVLP